VGDRTFADVCRDVLGSVTARASRAGAGVPALSIDDVLARHADDRARRVTVIAAGGDAEKEA